MTPTTGWQRLAAFGVDYLLIVLYMGVLALVSLVVPLPHLPPFQSPWQTQLLGFVSLTLPVTLYFALSEAWRGATLGKRLRGLCVVSASGTTLTLGRSLLRSALKFAPWELAHTAVHRFVFWERAGGMSAWQLSVVAALYALSLLLAGSYLLALFRAPRLTLYDRLSNLRVVHVVPQGGRYV